MYTNNIETPTGVNARLCVDHPDLTSNLFRDTLEFSRSDHPITASDAGVRRVLQTHPIHVAADFDITFEHVKNLAAG
ncbi:hypothetical protein ACN38_g44 [Penicillium nordicum]|uniref:Uncharacterized protein n=1 Tax=Penicillium nordicum TaxID=229535 RepID=A0A0M8PBD5_9EURO|nr:hypothetical protein ACN38_g44 [Penicillium nordicum]